MLSENIKKYRELKGLSKYKLSQLTGINDSQLSKLEKGTSCDPKLSTLRSLAVALDVAIGDLIREEGNDEMVFRK